MMMNRKVSLVFGAIVLFGATICSPAFAQELSVEGLELRGFGKCVQMEPRRILPCAILEKEGEDRVLYLILFNEDGSEAQKMVRQDYNTGKETTLWQKPVLPDPNRTQYPQKERDTGNR
jgi:hypothetical protein